jgi:hypothetical protein
MLEMSRRSFCDAIPRAGNPCLAVRHCECRMIKLMPKSAVGVASIPPWQTRVRLHHDGVAYRRRVKPSPPRISSKNKYEDRNVQPRGIGDAPP